MDGVVFGRSHIPIFDAHLEVLDRIHTALGYVGVIDLDREVAPTGVGRHRQGVCDRRTMVCHRCIILSTVELPSQRIGNTVINVIIHSGSDIHRGACTQGVCFGGKRYAERRMVG